LVQLCTVLDAMGYGLMHNDMHRLADQLVGKANVGYCEHVPISKHVTEGLLMGAQQLCRNFGCCIP